MSDSKFHIVDTFVLDDKFVLGGLIESGTIKAGMEAQLPLGADTTKSFRIHSVEGVNTKVNDSNVGLVLEALEPGELARLQSLMLSGRSIEILEPEPSLKNLARPRGNISSAIPMSVKAICLGGFGMIMFASLIHSILLMLMGVLCSAVGVIISVFYIARRLSAMIQNSKNLSQ